jgi:PAS domain S-box-containing protein
MEQPITVLYVDDYPLDRELVRDALEKEHGGFRVIEATSRADFEARLAEGNFDLVLSDFNILGFEGVQVIDAIHAKSPHTPVVIVTGTGSEEIAVEALKRGAADYIIKTPRHIQRLPRTIHAVLEKKRLKEEREQAEEALRESEEKYRNVVERANDGIVIIQDGVVRFANQRLAELWGGTPDEIIGTLFMSYVHPDELAQVADHYKRRLAGEPVSPIYETALRRKDGSKILAEINAGVILYEGQSADLVIIRDITERKQFEETLAKERNLMRTLIDNLPDLIFVKDLESRFVLVNQASLQTGQQTMAEIIGKNDFEINPPELAAQYYADDQAVIHSGQPVIDREECNISAGQTRWFSTTKVPLRDSEGQIIGLIGMSRDITERRQAQEMLRESEERFRLLYEKAPLGYQSLDAAGRFIDVNQAWLDTLGYSREEVIGRWFGDFLAPHEVELFKQRFSKFKAAREIQVEVEMVRKDGAHAILDIVGRVANDEHGGFKQTHCILTDITARKRAEEALEASDRLISLSSDLVCIADMDGYFKYVNPAWEKVLGYSKEELLAKPFLTFFHPEDHHKNDEEVAKLCQGKPTIDFENRYICRDGSIRYILWTATPDTERKLMYCIGRDITERKQADDALRESEEKFAKAFHTSPDALIISRQEDGVIIDTNESWEHLSGYSRAESIGQSSLALEVFADPAQRQQAAARLQAQGFLRDFELEIRRKSGEVRQVSLSLEPIELDQETCIITIARDITERKQVEMQLHEQLEELQRWHAATLGREGRILDLKREVNALLAQLGQPPRYPSAENS